MFVHEETDNNITLKEFCNRCGRSVKLGSGLFVNRIPDLNDIFTRQDNGYRFPLVILFVLNVMKIKKGINNGFYF